MANSPFFTEKHWITPDESPHATFCVFFSSDKGSTWRAEETCRPVKHAAVTHPSKNWYSPNAYRQGADSAWCSLNKVLAKQF